MVRHIKPPPTYYEGSIAQWESLTANQRQTKNNKEYNKVRHKAYNVKNKHQLATKAKARNKTGNRREKQAADGRTYRAAHRDEAVAYSKQYRIDNKENLAAKRRAKLCEDAADWWVANGGVLT
jgi:hypothetical protein